MGTAQCLPLKMHWSDSWPLSKLGMMWIIKFCLKLGDSLFYLFNLVVCTTGLELCDHLRMSCVLWLRVLSHVRLVLAPQTMTCEAPLSLGFSRQEYRSQLPFPSPGDLTDPETEPMSLVSPALLVDSLPTEPLAVCEIPYHKYLPRFPWNHNDNWLKS